MPRVESRERPATASLSSRLMCATFKASASAAVVNPTAATGMEMVRSNSIRSAPGASSESDSARDCAKARRRSSVKSRCAVWRVTLIRVAYSVILSSRIVRASVSVIVSPRSRRAAWSSVDRVWSQVGRGLIAAPVRVWL